MRILAPALGALLSSLPLVGLAQQELPGGMEEASALYFAPPDTEAASPAIDAERVARAGAVQLTLALAKIEAALSSCQDMRYDMQALIGDDYGSYSVNPGWLRRYQACVLQRAEEASVLGDAIEARQTELIARRSDDEERDTDGEQAMRAADMMSHLAARQSALRLAIAREGRRQRAFVRYYNTGEMPDELRRPATRSNAPAKQLERPEEEVAPDLAPTTPTSRVPASNADGPLGGAILMEGEEIKGSEPADAAPADATGGPTPLR